VGEEVEGGVSEWAALGQERGRAQRQEWGDRRRHIQGGGEGGRGVARQLEKEAARTGSSGSSRNTWCWHGHKESSKHQYQRSLRG
jgi:hypothetical protein